MNSKVPLAWVLVFCLASAFALVFLVRQRTESSHEDRSRVQATKQVTPTRDSTAEGTSGNAERVTIGSAPTAVNDRPAATQPVSTTGSILASYYGPEWDKVRPELEKRISLSLIPDIPLPAWESVLDQLQAAMKVGDNKFAELVARFAPPDPIRLDYLIERFVVSGQAIDDGDVAAIEALLVEPRAEIQDRLHRVRALCDGILAQKFWRGEYNYGPFASIYTDKLPKVAFYADSVGIKGWSVSWGIAADEDPELKSILLELANSKKQNRATIQQYLSEPR